jgi:hypothetical protein
VTIDKLIEVVLALAPRLGKNGLEGDKATPNTKTLRSVPDKGPFGTRYVVENKNKRIPSASLVSPVIQKYIFRLSA